MIQCINKIFYDEREIFVPRTQQILGSFEANGATDDSEIGSICDDGRLEISTDVNAVRGDVHPISYGTNWMPPPNFSAFKEAQRKISLKSFHTVTGVNDIQVIMKGRTFLFHLFFLYNFFFFMFE